MLFFQIENNFYWAIITFGKCILQTQMELFEPDRYNLIRLGPAQENSLWITARKHLDKSWLTLALLVSRLFTQPRASLFFWRKLPRGKRRENIFHGKRVRRNSINKVVNRDCKCREPPPGSRGERGALGKGQIPASPGKRLKIKNSTCHINRPNIVIFSGHLRQERTCCCSQSAQCPDCAGLMRN